MNDGRPIGISLTYRTDIEDERQINLDLELKDWKEEEYLQLTIMVIAILKLKHLFVSIDELIMYHKIWLIIYGSM